MTYAVVQPYKVFAGSDGSPLENGYIYIGQPNQNPEVYPLTAYWDEALSVTAAQPIRTMAGFPKRNGTPSNIYTATDYSITIRDKNGALVFSAPTSSLIGSAAQVSFIQSGTSAVATDVQSKLRELLGDFGSAMMYDNFNRSDRLLNGDTASSGQVWSLTGAGAAGASISNGKYTTSNNTYASLDYGQAITQISGSFSFGPPPSGTAPDRTSAVVVLIADTTLALQNVLHLIVGPNTWTLQKIVGGVFTGILGGTHYLRTDGAVYQVSYKISGTTVTVTAPDGSVSSVTDADIGVAIQPRYGTWQLNNSTANVYTGSWEAIAIGKRPSNDLIALGGAAPMSDATFLYGAGFAQRRGLRNVSLTGGIGWYTIATGTTTLGVFAIAGDVFISAVDTGTYAALIRLLVGAEQGNTSPDVYQLHVKYIVGTPIDQVRLSTSGAAVQLDIHLSRANVMTLNAEFIGQFTPVEAPVVGAVALGTGSTVVDIDLTLGKKSVVPLVTVTYATTMAIDASRGNLFNITATDGVAFTVSSPTNGSAGQRITLTIRNTSGGVLGAVTWGANYRMSAWTSPANNNNRSVDFRLGSDGLWTQIAQTGADISN